MRQKAGRVAKPEAATPGGGPPAAGASLKAPAGTRVAAVTLPWGTAAPASSAQVLAAAGPAARPSAMQKPSKIVRIRFMAPLP